MSTEIRHADRRSCPRSREAHLLTVTSGDSPTLGAHIHTGLTLDVSTLGAHIETPEPLVLGEELNLEIAFADRILLARGKAVHTEMLANGLCGAGIRFTSEGLHGANGRPGPGSRPRRRGEQPAHRQ